GNLKVGDTNGEPVKITNVTSTLPDTYSTANDANNPDGKAPTTAQQVPSLTANELNNAATVGDVLNAGWNLKTEDQGDLDFVKPYDTVEFVNGKGTTVESKTDGETSTITYNVNVDNATTYITAKDAAGNTLYQGADGKFYTGPNSQGEAVEPVGDTYITANVAVIDAKVGSVNAKDGKAEVGTGTSPTDAVSAGSVADTINKVGFTVTANDPAAGDVNNDGLVNAGETLNFADGANTKVVVEGNTVTYNVTGLPVQYTTEDGQPVAKVGDNYYPVGKDGLPDTTATPIPADQLVTNVINPAASSDEIGAPTKLGNIASTLPATYNDDALNTAGVAPTKGQALPELTPAQLSNAATIGDVLNAGWNLQNNGEARDFVKPYDIVNFVDGKGTTAVVTTAADGVSSDVTYNANYDNLTINVGGTAYKVTQNPDGTYTYVLPGAGTDAGTGGLKVNGNPDAVNNNTSPEGQGSILINGQGTHVSVDNSTGEIKVDSPLAYVGNETAGDTSTATDTVSFVGATTDAPVQAQNLASGVRDILASGGDALPSAYINAGTDANGNPVSATTYTPAQRQAIAAAVNNASGDTLTNAANIGDVQAAAAAAKTEVRAGENVRVDTATGDNGQTIYTVHAAAPDLSPINKRLDDIEKGANAGVSSAMAMATLPQAYIPGKSMLTGGVASYNGEGAVAVGFSKLSDNGRWVLKMSGSADTDGNVGGAVGAGFHF
ncbi:MAG: YadA C-terminal domain-containing protein, partial [Moraxella sp.]|uniref:YadA family autotransporter adhesin n=1 Tax=Moraxella sp. TaxID=479 RepID=UPI0026DAF7ED